MQHPADLPGGGPRQCRGQEPDALGPGSADASRTSWRSRAATARPREARCWETGVPAFHLNPGLMHIIQTPKEVVLFLTGRVRHIWLDVPHSANPKPSWYGESVGRYEGDTLVVDTIGFNDKTFVDSYRTPHTDKLHVVERFRLIDGGNTLEVAFTVEDPGAFYQPWSGTRNRHRVVNPKRHVCRNSTARRPTTIISTSASSRCRPPKSPISEEFNAPLFDTGSIGQIARLRQIGGMLDTVTPAMMLEPVLTPRGTLTLRPSGGDGAALAPERGLRLVSAFGCGFGHGLLHLGADEVGTRPAAGAFILARLCGALRDRIVRPPGHRGGRDEAARARAGGWRAGQDGCRRSAHDRRGIPDRGGARRSVARHGCGLRCRTRRGRALRAGVPQKPPSGLEPGRTRAFQSRRKPQGRGGAVRVSGDLHDAAVGGRPRPSICRSARRCRNMPARRTASGCCRC